MTNSPLRDFLDRRRQRRANPTAAPASRSGPERLADRAHQGGNVTNSPLGDFLERRANPTATASRSGRERLADRANQVRVIAVERSDFVEPHIATGLREVFVPARLVSHRPDVHRGRPNYLIVALADGASARDWIDPQAVARLPADGYRMDDIVNVERRAIDRENQSAGFIAGEVDKPVQPGHPLWLDLIPAFLGIGLTGIGILMALNSVGG